MRSATSALVMPPEDEISERTDELDGRSRDLRDAWDADCSEHGATRITELLFAFHANENHKIVI